MNIKADCNGLRDEIGQMGAKVKALKQHDFFSQSHSQRTIENPTADAGEMQANIMIAYRHLEDARMRVGKIIQAFEGGVSHFDKS